jgi:glycosyltransferase involved in cell wall biosynthesis
MPELSICVLTRDNQDTCKTTISGILRDAQLGFELLVIDASETPNELKTYIGSLEDDRVRYVHVAAKDRQEHWNIAIPECNGDWLTFILDGDYIDPKIIEVIRRMKLDCPQVESLGWNKVDYDWPEQRSEVRATKISTEHGAYIVDKNEMRDRFFGYEKEGLIPFSIYHGIVKRELVERIRHKFGGVYFEHQITSYEFGYKVLAEANELAFTGRALSVLCTHSEDMLSEASILDDIEHKKSHFYRDINVIDNLSEFPFASDWSPKIFGAIVLRWLVDRYGDEFFVEGWESNFVKWREEECNALYSDKRFGELSTLYQKAIENWHNGKFSKLFAPKFNQKLRMQKDLIGCFHGFLFLDKNALGSTNPAEFYNVFQNFVPTTGSIGLKLVEKTKKAA